MKLRAAIVVISVMCGSLFAQPADLPDLVVASTQISEGRVSAVITNRGRGTVVERSRTTLFIFEGSRPMRKVNVPAPALRPGASATVTFDTLVPPGAQYQVMADSDERINERNETNNRTTSQTVPGGSPRPVPPEPRVTVDSSLMVHTRPITLKPSPDGQPRPVAAARFPKGAIVPFVENELLITSSSTAAVEALAARRGGRIVSEIPPPPGSRTPTFVVRVNTAVAPQNVFTAREDGFVFSSLASRNLLAIAMEENAGGARVGINLIGESQGFFEQKTIEGGGTDALSFDYMQSGGTYDVDVTGAWKALFQAGKLSSKWILIGVVDRGFAIKMSTFTESDYEVAGWSNAGQRDSKGGWHGNNVAESAAGLADDGRGSAGPAGPIARVGAFDTGDHSLSSWRLGLTRAHLAGAKIINMSLRLSTPRGNWFTSAWDNGVESFEEATIAYQNAGLLLFASAGNDSTNVDALNEDGEEAAWFYPCENQGVICVGGWWDDKSSKSVGQIPAIESNFGSGLGETVDIWGPMTTRVGDHPDNPGKDVVQPFRGTSAASPFVAGVAALIWTANPNLTNMQVWDIMNRNAIKAGTIRRVHAYRAVREALLSTNVNTPPAVRIVWPVQGATFSQAQSAEFTAETYDVEDGCCTVSWSINGKPTAAKHSFANDSLGQKTIDVVITDKGGKMASATVTTTVVNRAPFIRISNAPPGPVTQKLLTPFRAEVTDDALHAAAVPSSTSPLCSGVVWTSSLDPGLQAAGCEPAIAFKTPGVHTLMASITDKHGVKATDTKNVNVIVASSVLEGSILAPQNNDSFWFTDTIELRWAELNLVGQPTVHWSLIYDRTGKKGIVKPQLVNGLVTFRIADVFPELQGELFNNREAEPMTLNLRLMSSSGQVSDLASVTIRVKPRIH